MPPPAGAVPVVRIDDRDSSSAPVASKREPHARAICGAKGKEGAIETVIGLIDEYDCRIVLGYIDHPGLAGLNLNIVVFDDHPLFPTVVNVPAARASSRSRWIAVIT